MIDLKSELSKLLGKRIKEGYIASVVLDSGVYKYEVLGPETILIPCSEVKLEDIVKTDALDPKSAALDLVLKEIDNIEVSKTKCDYDKGYNSCCNYLRDYIKKQLLGKKL